MLTSMNLQLYAVYLGSKLLRIQLGFSTPIAIARVMKEKARTHFQRKQISLLLTKLCSFELSDMAGKILTKRKTPLLLEFHIKSQSIGFMKLTNSKSLHPCLDKCYK